MASNLLRNIARFNNFVKIISLKTSFFFVLYDYKGRKKKRNLCKLNLIEKKAIDGNRFTNWRNI